MRQPQPREVSAANEPLVRGKRSAAPTRDTAETGFAGPLVSSPVGESGEADSGGCSVLGEASLQVPRTLRVAQGTAKRHGRGSLFFGYFFLALLKKSNSPAGARPGLLPERSKPSPTNKEKHKNFLRLLSATPKTPNPKPHPLSTNKPVDSSSTNQHLSTSLHQNQKLSIPACTPKPHQPTSIANHKTLDYIQKNPLVHTIPPASIYYYYPINKISE